MSERTCRRLMSDERPAEAEESLMELLHLLLRGRWDVASGPAARALLARGEIDGEALLRRARAEGVSPLLYHTIRDRNLLPPAVEQALRLDYFHSAACNVHRFHRLEPVLRRLAAAGVDVILLKGAALAEAVYGNLALRPMCDFDLLVRERDVSTALGVLSDLGYACPYQEFRPGFIRAFRNQVMMSKAEGGGRPIEIHWRLISPLYYQRAIAVDWLWRTAQPICVGSASAWMLSPEAQVLHLCGHLLQHGGCRRASLLQLYDLAAVTALYEGRIDWDQVLARARDCDLVLPLRQALERVRRVLHAPIPPDVLERLRGLHPSQGEERVHGLLSGTAPVARRLWVGLVSIPGWRARLRYVWGNLFPSADYMQRQYGIPYRLLLPFYYPYRWLRGLRRVGG